MERKIAHFRVDFCLRQNESWCKTFQMEMSLICKTMNVSEMAYFITCLGRYEIAATANERDLGPRQVQYTGTLKNINQNGGRR